MSYTWQVFPEADRDIDEIAEFIGADNVDAGARFYGAMSETLREIVSNPMAWPRYESRRLKSYMLRKRTVKGFKNYLVFYRVNDSHIDVLRVLHGARDIPEVLTHELLDD